MEIDLDLECELDLELIGDGDLDSISMISNGSSVSIVLFPLLETLTSLDKVDLIAESSGFC